MDVFLTAAAVRDLEEIDAYLLWRDGPEAAEQVLGAIEARLASLASQPARGHAPPELLALGIREFLEIRVGAYRLIYQLRDAVVYVHVVAHGRRDMQRLLLRRLMEEAP
ncbi:MAG: type II toxin-antitoxin system RelE/ParE family toxin [Solidesulfovibrio sp.]|uniref:type II toxin-antitoxin system RelE/ParE family toxin n=1 Tax=Solidesulfovibrio sp. TaxID=2910990 RepID=UPI002B21882F|nr:type II toxin-antitoxin system RelE/ParE family toxin [Solidesulfovibrio sp.]MEA4855708.1 type II toxin-antitoxin system RelE/ParE family toxin [Solidesulfovibrio sp.]